MMKIPSRRLAFLLLLPAALLWRCSPGSVAGEVTVAAVGSGGAGARAGLRPGDVLLPLTRPPARPAGPAAAGPFPACFAFLELEVEQAPRGPVTFALRRWGRAREVTLPPGEWRVAVLPRRAPAAEVRTCEAFNQAVRAIGERRFADARKTLDELLAGSGQADPRVRAHLLYARGLAAFQARDFPAAEGSLRDALALVAKAAPASLSEAAVLHLLGRVQRARSAPDTRALLERAAALRSRLAPESLELAATLNQLGALPLMRGDTAAAAPFFNRALALIRRRLPDSREEADVRNNLGVVARYEGDPERAESELLRTKALYERTDPRGEGLGRVLSNLGSLAGDRGDFARSDEYFRQAVDLYQELAPESLEMMSFLLNLGVSARERHDLEEARDFFNRALTLSRRLVPGSAIEATVWNNLASVAFRAGDLAGAERLASRGLSITRATNPESQNAVTSLSILAAVAGIRGELDRAERLEGEAGDLQRRLGGSPLHESDHQVFLAQLAVARRQWGQAEGLLRQALALHERLAPGTARQAAAWNVLGQALYGAGRLAQAEEAFTAALSALEAQVGRIGGTDETRSNLRGLTGKYYHDLIDLEIARQRPERALATLERSRARTLLALLAERELVFGPDVPASLLTRQRRLDRAYRETGERLSRLDPVRQAAAVEELSADLARLRGERSALVSEIVRASPRYGSLRYPTPAGLPGVRASLDAGTVLLTWSVAKDESYLFAVLGPGVGKPGEPPLLAFRLPLGERALESEVKAFRSLIQQGREGAAIQPALLAQGRRLYELLLLPAEPAIARAERLLISPEGPLLVLPFGALVRPGKPGETPRYLIAEKPLHTVASATLYAELKAGRRATAPAGPVILVADPRYAAPGRPAGPELEGAAWRRYRQGLAALPGARAEVAALSALFGPRASVFVGAAASEGQVKRLPSSLGYLHFACHSLLDLRFPLDSGLALAAPARPSDKDNGLLQAWEIFKLRLDADLVTLSACSTGLGRKAGGEGLLGLSRAFQYAGARSIVASLWPVTDRSTAELMERFYAELAAGRPKDLALAAAQRALLADRRRRFSHPFYWAAFELIGDWR